MSRLLLTISVTIAAVIGGFYQFSLKPKLIVFGQGRVVEPIGNTKCKTYDGATACEKISLHEPTGHLYMACSTQQSRAHWLPATNQLNATGKSSSDYVAVFDPATSKVTRLRTQGFKFPRGLSVHGMDVVQSALRPSEILIYLINHREPMAPRLAVDVGADSVIEIFRTRPGSEEMHYVVTFKDPVISTPNDVVATGDDKSFFFTNDHGFVKSGLARRLNLDIYFGRAWSNVGYCHAENGCKVAVDNISGANGITKDKDGKYYVASSKSTEVFVLERQADSSLVITDVIHSEHPIDNLSVDKSGAIWGAGMVNALHRVNVHFVNPKIISPSSAFRITPNDGQSRYFGEKYKVEKKFEDDGEIASGSTSVVYDSQRKKLYLHGIAAPHLTVCDIE
ncbi:calcium-dependent phosphotriesterase [Phellopilus nigrolimitatus]|nr:calcium-dependent phosphotriesterase [Phellopilus nigrolimitatus]